MGVRIIHEIIEKGDIILTGENSIVSIILSLLTWSRYSHAMIYGGNGFAYESELGGVQRVNITENFFEKRDICILRPKFNVTKTEKDLIVEYLRNQLGVPYSIPHAILSSKWIQTVFKLALHSNRQFCSRLVLRAYQSAELIISDNMDFTCPKDLKNRFTMEITEATKKSSEKLITPNNKVFAAENNLKLIGRLLHKIRKKFKLDDLRGIKELGKSLSNPAVEMFCNSYLEKNIGQLNPKHQYVGEYFSEIMNINEPYRYNYISLLLDGYADELVLSARLLRDYESSLGKNNSDALLLIGSVLHSNHQIIIARNMEIFLAAQVIKHKNIRVIENFSDNDSFSSHLYIWMVINGVKIPPTWRIEKTTIEDMLYDCAANQHLEHIVCDAMENFDRQDIDLIKKENIHFSKYDENLNRYTRELSLTLSCRYSLKTKSSEIAFGILLKYAEKEICNYLSVLLSLETK